MQADYKNDKRSGMKMKRIFIALDVEVEEKLGEMISLMKSEFKEEGIKWTAIDNMHITLVFLGDTGERLIKNIISMMNQACRNSGQFEITLRGTGVFKSMDDPRVLWTGIDPSGRLMELNKMVIGLLHESGYETEERRFSPHLTIARIKHIKDKKLLKKFLDDYHNMEFQKVHVNEVILYESILLQSGPVYKPLARFNLQ